MEKEYILYLGNYLDEHIVEERKLPTHNTAGTNRMQRLSDALSLYYLPLVISPGVSLRIKKNSSRLFLPSKFHHKGNVTIFFSKAIAVPYLSVFYSYITYFFSLLSIIRRTKAKKIIIYNFDPLLLFIVLFLRCFYWRIKLVNNIEDISIPKFSDFTRKSEDSAIQQNVFFICMKIIATFSSGYVIPTKKFLNYLPNKENVLLVTGCLAVKNPDQREINENLEILFSGKIAFEHGIDVFIDALKQIEESTYSDKLNVNISGGGDKKEWLSNEVKQFKRLNVKYHGFVSNQEYRELLKKADVCVALQKDIGRHAKFKTPSKVYEYLGNSKVVIATDVGDLAEINKEFIKICRPVDGLTIKKRIIELIERKDFVVDLKEQAYVFSKSEYDLSVVGEKFNKFLR